MVNRSSIPKPNAPVRRISQNDKAILRTTSWAENSDLKYHDTVSVADSKAVFLSGIVTYMGSVHFSEETWVGIQLTGPSLGKGNSNGTFRGKTYFGNVGASNGLMVPRDQVNNYKGRPVLDLEEQRATVDVLTNSRVAEILKRDNKNRKNSFYREEVYVERLKNTLLGDAIQQRHQDNESSKLKLKYSKPGTTLSESDFELVKGLDKTHQNFCLSDPTLPDNPITYASPAFLDLTQYHLCEILGINCRFLQGKKTEQVHVDRIRQSIIEGSDCHVCLLNYRKDGSPFYNRLFMTALRDVNGRVKNYLGVQCEVTDSVAQEINETELKLFNSGMQRKGAKFTKRNKGKKMTDNDDSNRTRGSRCSDSSDTPNEVFDVDEAIFRSCMDDPFSDMPEDLEMLYEKLKSDPFAGYTTVKKEREVSEEFFFM